MPSGATYNHETVAIDGETFSDCEFQNARLVYSGGEPPTFSGCRFSACEWQFQGAAAHTLSHLKTLWGLGEKRQVQDLIKEVTGSSR